MRERNAIYMKIRGDYRKYSLNPTGRKDPDFSKKLEDRAPAADPAPPAEPAPPVAEATETYRIEPSCTR